MSEAFEKSLEELNRIWNSADHFDNKVLQFVGIVGAGTFAAAAIAADKFPLQMPPIWWLVVRLLLAYSIVSLIMFAWQAAHSTLSDRPFAGVVDPRLVAKKTHLHPDDHAFRAAAWPALASAFEISLAAYEAKWRAFRASLRHLALATVALATAGLISLFTVVPTKEGSMDNQSVNQEPSAPNSIPAPAAPSPGDTSQSPSSSAPADSIGPYLVHRGAKEISPSQVGLDTKRER